MHISGDELRRRREAMGLTQERLAEELDVATNTIARWERGERSIPSFLSLALETLERRAAKKKKAKT